MTCDSLGYYKSAQDQAEPGLVLYLRYTTLPCSPESARDQMTCDSLGYYKVSSGPGRAWVGSVPNIHNPSTKLGLGACIGSSAGRPGRLRARFSESARDQMTCDSLGYYKSAQDQAEPGLVLYLIYTTLPQSWVWAHVLAQPRGAQGVSERAPVRPVRSRALPGAPQSHGQN
jgi:hypothetical protein